MSSDDEDLDYDSGSSDDDGDVDDNLVWYDGMEESDGEQDCENKANEAKSVAHDNSLVLIGDVAEETKILDGIVAMNPPVETTVESANAASRQFTRTQGISRYTTDDGEWTVQDDASAPGSCTVSHKTCMPLQTPVYLPKSRLRKYQHKLSPNVLVRLLNNPSSCVPNCQKQCHMKFALGGIIQARQHLYSTAKTENEVTAILADRLKTANSHIAITDPDADPEEPEAKLPNQKTTLSYVISGVPVCSRWWAAYWGVSEDKMKAVRRLVKHGGRTVQHGNKGKKKTFTKEEIAYCFWFLFFEVNCQRPNDDCRLFPINASFKFIYDYYFSSWFTHWAAKNGQDNCWMPKISTFKKARHHPDFKDVKRRARHYHAMCQTCSALRTRRLKGFANDSHEQKWQILFDAHEAEKIGWRRLEKSREAEVTRPNSDSILLAYDDTSSLGLPQCSNRGLKNLPKSRFHVIPFNICNYASGESAYVYTVKNRYKKGANRLCTVIYHFLRKIKWGKDESRKARVLYLHADNYSENKNNTFFAFLSELIYRGWFDEIVLEFGPPGHTHNGRDAVHFIHNRIAGNFFCFTLGHFQSQWQHSWRKNFTQPEAVIADVQYNFKKRYKHAKKLSGFTKTKFDKDAAFAFRLKKNQKGLVELTFKAKAADPSWLGENHQPMSPGFVLLSQIPHGAPEIIPAKEKVMRRQYIREVIGDSMKQMMENHVTETQAQESLQWLEASCNTGSMPYDRVDANETVPELGQWGPAVKVGASGLQGDFFLMEPLPTTSHTRDFWKLPVELEEQKAALGREQAELLRSLQQLPNLRYSGVKPGDARAMQRRAQEQAERKQQPPENASAVSSGSESDDQADDQADAPDHRVPEWGAPFTECIAGRYAAVLVEDSASGDKSLQVVTVADVIPFGGDNDDCDKFNGYDLQCTKDKTKIACLDAKWFPPPTRKRAKQEYPGWCVLGYFNKMTTAGKFTKAVRDNITAKILEEDLDLFKDENSDDSLSSSSSESVYQSSDESEEEYSSSTASKRNKPSKSKK